MIIKLNIPKIVFATGLSYKQGNELLDKIPQELKDIYLFALSLSPLANYDNWDLIGDVKAHSNLLHKEEDFKKYILNIEN